MSIERVNRQGGMVWRVRWREGRAEPLSCAWSKA